MTHGTPALVWVSTQTTPHWGGQHQQDTIQLMPAGGPLCQISTQVLPSELLQVQGASRDTRRPTAMTQVTVTPPPRRAPTTPLGVWVCGQAQEA